LLTIWPIQLTTTHGPSPPTLFPESEPSFICILLQSLLRATLIWIEVLVIGYIEFQRNAELDSEKRLYPGGKFFDPFLLTVINDLKTREDEEEEQSKKRGICVCLLFFD
jgi:hypothetical protein